MNNNYSVAAFYSEELRHPRYGLVKELQQRLLILDNIYDRDDFMAWLFPWSQEIDDSNAPLITSMDLEKFRHHYELRRVFNRSLQIILSYYGVQMRAEAVHASETFAQVASLWLFNKDTTNLQRLTHIIRSMTLLGEKHLAESLLGFLTRVQQAFSQQLTLAHLQSWQQAIVEGEKQFYLLFTQGMYSYVQFWQRLTETVPMIPLKKLIFSKPDNAQLLISLINAKGFHATHVGEDLDTLTIYQDQNNTVIYLTQGQLALCETLFFQLPDNSQPISGKELIAELLR